MEEQVLQVWGHFPALGRIASVQRISGEHIHESFQIETAGTERFVLQRINRGVFPHPEAVLENLDVLQAHLDARGDGSVALLRYLPCDTGERLYEDGTAAAGDSAAMWRTAAA